MAGVLDTARFKCFVAEALNVLDPGHRGAGARRPRGRHGAAAPALDRGRRAAHRAAAQGQAGRHRRSGPAKGGGELVALYKTGSAYFAPAASRDRDGGELPLRPQARAARARRCSRAQYGINGYFIGVPVQIGAGGVEKIIELELDDAEKAELEKSFPR